MTTKIDVFIFGVSLVLFFVGGNGQPLEDGATGSFLRRKV